MSILVSYMVCVYLHLRSADARQCVILLLLELMISLRLELPQCTDVSHHVFFRFFLTLLM